MKPIVMLSPIAFTWRLACAHTWSPAGARRQTCTRCGAHVLRDREGRVESFADGSALVPSAREASR